MALTLACAAALTGCTKASPPPSSSPGIYLALGDSVPFGYRGKPAGLDYSKASNFTGYPELVAKKLGAQLVNAACPGETTESFYDMGALSNGCENALHSDTGYRTAYPLHVKYARGQSQLDFALQTLRQAKVVSLVTVQLGANNAFICQQTTNDNCTADVAVLMKSVQDQLEHILMLLHDVGHYGGKIVVVTYYSLQYTGSAVAGTEFLNSAIEAAAKAQGATVASGFDAFQAPAMKAGGDSQAAGLVIAGDVHPTAKGQELLAEAVERAAFG